MKIENIIQEGIQKALKESTKVNFSDMTFILKIDVNEAPNKKGIKVQFIPTEPGGMSKTRQNDIAIELGKRLEEGLSDYSLKVERDRELKDKTIIAFFIYIEYIDIIIRKALNSQNQDIKDPDQTPK